MRFKMPESLEGLSIEQLDELHKDAFGEYAELTMKDDSDVTDADLDDLEALGGHLATLETEKATQEAASQERADKLASARARVAEADAPAEDAEAESEDGDEGEGDADPEEPEDADAEKEKELVTASAKSRGTVRKAASRAPEQTQEIEPEEPRGFAFVAAAAVGDVSVDAEFRDFAHTAQAFGKRAEKGPGNAKFQTQIAAHKSYGLSDKHTRLAFARLRKPEIEFAARTGMTASEQMQLIDDAANEKNLKDGSLIAAGGWCAPSEIVYDFCSFETVSGILDIPTINLSRGGLIYSKGPDYASIAADWGFTQTEAEAEAGTEKTCYAVECPPFDEIRLDAVGFCITAGVLTNATYPELIRRVLEIGAVAHAHKVNADVIQRISDEIGAALDFTEVGSATADLLDALALAGEHIRYMYSMAPGATLEVVLPVWAKRIIQSDLSRRTGVDLLAVSDADIARYFSVRNIRVQWVYDYQVPADGSWLTWPTTLEFMIYPAGAFVKGTTDVIDLDTIYDSVGLSTNTYTAAFFEEGLAVFNRCGSGLKYQIDISCLAGVTGAAELSCEAGV